MSKRAAPKTIDLTGSSEAGEEAASDTAVAKKRRETEPEENCLVRTNIRVSKETVRLYQVVSVSADIGGDGSITSRVTGIPRGFALGKQFGFLLAVVLFCVF